ncbi:MAG TPA: hypothetical protein PKE32_10240, partial [Miltoncostaeaceae bacterium]|nr:hypothetical protein [Miltoncostaeaceae bacterium]
RLKIVVSPVRIRVSPSPGSPLAKRVFVAHVFDVRSLLGSSTPDSEGPGELDPVRGFAEDGWSGVRLGGIRCQFEIIRRRREPAMVSNPA